MSDPYNRPVGDPNHGQWSQPSGYPGQYDPSQRPYPGVHSGQYASYGQYPNGGQYLQPRTHGMTIFAMVTGIVAAVVSVVPFVGFVSFVLGPLAMVLGIVGIAKRLSRRGFSVTALVTGTFGLLVSVLYAVLFSVFIAFADDTQTFEFMADGTAEYKVSVTTTSEASNTTTEQGSFSQAVEASTLFGGISATNSGGAGETVSCQIYDSTGNLLLEDSDNGEYAVATCELADVLLDKVEDLHFPEEISAREAG